MIISKEDKIRERIEKLKEIATEYDRLDDKTNGKYRRRFDKIWEEIEVLQTVIDGTDTIEQWLEQLEKDKAEAEADRKKKPEHREWGEIVE